MLPLTCIMDKNGSVYTPSKGDSDMNQYLHMQNKRMGKLRPRLFAVIALLLVSSVMLGSASFAWLILSRAPEVAGVASNIGANGNLEIALGKNIGESAVGDSSEKIKVTQANRTWGNIVDLTDASYGLQVITLRPVLLNAAGGAVNTLHPFAHPVYGEDGRIETIYANDMFAGVYNGERFFTSADEYGVRGIGTAEYVAPGNEGTFGPMSRRQELYFQACENLWGMTRSGFETLCERNQSVLMAYCYYGTGISAAEFDLDAFAREVDDVVSAANEELRLGFTLLAAAEMTPSASYLMAIDHLEDAYPNYEVVQPAVHAAIQATGAVETVEAIAELRAFQDAAAQLKAVIASGEINGSDGYSMEEIEKTVGLIFDLEKTNFSIGTVTYDEKNYDLIQNNFYSNVLSGLYYQIPYDDRRGWDSWESDFGDLSVDNMTSSLQDADGYGDNDSREDLASTIYWQMNEISESLPLADLDQGIAGLYISHWNYWDAHAEEYQLLQEETAELETQVKLLEDTIAEKQAQADVDPNEISALEAELQAKSEQLQEKNTQLQALLDEKIYAPDDSNLETIRSVMQDAVEAVRKYTLWSIAYFACDGQVPDDAYHRMWEIANSSGYVHPRTAYQTLCNYSVTPPDALTEMVAAYEKLEKELNFLTEKTDAVTWPELNAELQRVFGTIKHYFYFHDRYAPYSYSGQYFPEDIAAPTEVMTNLRDEIKKLEDAITDSKSYNHRITYGAYDENQLWAQALNVLDSFYDARYPFEYGTGEYTLEDRPFTTEHDMYYSDGFRFGIGVGVGSEDNFNESGLTVRQTRFKNAQESISYYQNQLITAAVNADKDPVALLMQMIAGQNSVSLVTISDYLVSLQQQLDYAEEMLYQAALAMAASDYAEDSVYRTVYSDSAPKNAAGLIELLRQGAFDEKVLNAFDHRMELLNDQKAQLNRSVAMLENYQNPQTGALLTEQIPAAEAAALLDPVLDMDGLTLYAYVQEEPEQEQDGETEATLPPAYLRTVLYAGFGSPAVQINGNQATIGSGEPITVFGDVYLSLENSLAGSMLAFAKTQVETYTPPAGSLDAGEIADFENGMNRQSYAIGTGENVFTLNLHTADTPYALTSNLWDYTGNTNYISANRQLVDVYGYCVDLSFRTNATGSNLLLQTDAANRIYSGDEAQTDTTMGAGSYMEFTIVNQDYPLNKALEYMGCLRVAITDTNTGYIYGYAVLDMDAVEVAENTIKAPLRLFDKDTGMMVEGDAAQYLCRLDQNLEKNLTVYVYLDGAKITDAMVSAYDKQSLQGALNLQFCSSADLKPAVISELR